MRPRIIVQRRSSTIRVALINVCCCHGGELERERPCCTLVVSRERSLTLSIVPGTVGLPVVVCGRREARGTRIPFGFSKYQMSYERRSFFV